MSATVSTPSADRWWSRLVRGHPHEIISGPDHTPYLLRYYLIPRNRHPDMRKTRYRFISSDDPVPHDHPWSFLSLVLHGRYVEVTAAGRAMRWAGTLAYRPATYRHRVELLRDRSGREIPCWTIIVTGARRRPWGFWCPSSGSDRFVPWQQFGRGGCQAPTAPTTQHSAPAGHPR